MPLITQSGVNRHEPTCPGVIVILKPTPKKTIKLQGHIYFFHEFDMQHIPYIPIASVRRTHFNMSQSMPNKKTIAHMTDD